MNQKGINNTVVEMKNYFDGFTSRQDIPEERNNELESMSIETSQTGFNTFPNYPPKWLYQFTFPSAECICAIPYTFTQTGYPYFKKLHY